MNERSAIVFGAVIGAALGGFAGYLFLTESGTRLRRRLEPQLSDVLHEFQALQGAVARARDAATRGWRAAADDEAGEWREAGQTAPY